jgi:hypothetical protein
MISANAACADQDKRDYDPFAAITSGRLAAQTRV